MSRRRPFRMSTLIPTLFLGVALALALAPWGAVPDGPAYPAAGQDGTRAGAPAAPILVGRAPADAGPGAAADEGSGAGAPNAPLPAKQDDAEDALADDASGDPAAPDSPFDNMMDGLPLTAEHPRVAPVIAIQERHTNDLLRHPLVVGTAVGMNEQGEIAVVVLAKSPIHDLPSTLDGAPLMTFVSGELFSSKGKPSGKGKTQVDRTARFERPVPIGISTGHPNITAGTIGCRCTDGTNVFALSNNHVYADENLATIGDAVIQPGTYDGGSSPADDIGTLSAASVLDFTLVQNGGANIMDAALASTDTATVGAGTPGDGYGLPKSATLSPSINLRVRKYGRTTGQTNGKVYAINASVNVGYSGGVAGFVGQIVITPGSYSAGGDSGSLIVVQKGADARKSVGLLFAGSSSSTIASPIGPILSAFGVSIDGE